jgi:hypothetical protein
MKWLRAVPKTTAVAARSLEAYLRRRFSAKELVPFLMFCEEVPLAFRERHFFFVDHCIGVEANVLLFPTMGD